MPRGSSSSGSRSKDIAKKRALQGGSPTRTDVFDDPEVNAKYPYAQALKQMLLTSHNFPVFTYTPQLVEVLGRELQPGGRRREEGGGCARRDRGRVDRTRQEGRQAEVGAHGTRDGHAAARRQRQRRYGCLARPPLRLAHDRRRASAALLLVILFPVFWAVFTSLHDYTLIAPNFDTFTGAGQFHQGRSTTREFRHALWLTRILRRRRWWCSNSLLGFLRRADAQQGRALQAGLLRHPALPAADEPGHRRPHLAHVPASAARHRELSSQPSSASRRSTGWAAPRWPSGRSSWSISGTRYRS